MRFKTLKLGLILIILFSHYAIVESWYINSTGGSFPATVYQEATFSYQFLSTGDFVSYLGEGSTTGKCNVMGYWHTGNISPTQSAISPAVKLQDTLICTDACTVTSCGISSAVSPRFDRLSREPLVDFAGSDSLLKPSDYAAFPDLLMLPALAGAAVAVYNIPELISSSNNTGPLVLSRQNIADIFKGKILFWNDTRIISNNNELLGTILSGIMHPIRVVVRTDSSGTSEIFSTALSLFDPAGLSTPDYSFGGTIGQGSNPEWCGSLTDEVQVITINGCNSASPSTVKFIHLKVVDAARIMRDLNFTCDASAGDVAAAFAISTPGPNLSIYVGRSISQIGVIKYTIGYSDFRTLKRNWYKPSIVSLPTGVTLTISTLQEGGYLNSHFNSTYYVTPQIQSIWISSLAPSFNYRISWTSVFTKAKYIVDLNSLQSANNISTLLSAAYAGSVTSVKRVTSAQSIWIEYRVTFAMITSSIFSTFTATAAIEENDQFIFMNTYLDYRNYPLFYDFLHPRGYGGSGR